LDQSGSSGRVWWLAVGDRVDLTGVTGYFGGLNVGVAVSLERKPRQGGDALACGDEGLA
jgi:hypothetical protein